MPTFRTIIPLKKQKQTFGYHDKFMLMGSCFAENMGDYLQKNQFQTLVNPFGIIFNTASLSKIIHRLVNLDYFTSKDCFENQGIWSSFEVHSCMNNLTEVEFLDNLNQQIDVAHRYIKESTVFILTLGTSWVYKHIDTNEIVANCHKIEQKKFEKHLLSTVENEKYLNQIIQDLKTINPEIKLIITVSPVRHIKDGFVENTLSKAQLISAIHSILTIDMDYFPSYEIMMDDLRDYRFYAEDMLHPNQLATAYIWENFIQSYFSEETHQILKLVYQINNGLNHRPFNENHESHIKFKSDLSQKIHGLKQNYPWMFNNK